MGVLPLLLPEGVHPSGLAITSKDRFELDLSLRALAPRCAVDLTIHHASGGSRQLTLQAAIETSLEVKLLEAGGLIPHVLSGLLAE